MRNAIVCAVLLLPLFARADEGRAKRELIALENHWLAVEDDPHALQSILAPDFLHVVSAGIITKRQQLDFMRKHPRPKDGHSERHFEDWIVAKGGQTRKTGFIDGFAFRDGKWMAVNAQELPLSSL